jgi:hypothetical protein
MHLPISQDIPVNLLAASFNKKVATYKFYWLLSILQSVENGQVIIPKIDLFSRMLSNAWYTVNYFHVSFGKQDLIQDAVYKLKIIEGITIDEKQDIIRQKLISSTKKESLRILKHFDKNVPHWFLSPWFPKWQDETDAKRKNRIYQESKNFSQKYLYALYPDRIEINPVWKDYLITNSKVLKDFCYWNFALYLQTKNPNVPDIPNKLIRPAIRNNLSKQRTQFWNLVLNELGTVDCIYTGKKLTAMDYAVEHFIPYNFVSHDLIWNLIPADKSFNSSKSDKLPSLDRYFNPFFDLQKAAIDIVKIKNPKNIFLEDYLTIFPNLEESFSKEKFRESIQPLIIIASNNGFEFLS